jgi:hypothetical protein
VKKSIFVVTPVKTGVQILYQLLEIAGFRVKPGMTKKLLV